MTTRSLAAAETARVVHHKPGLDFWRW